MDCRWTRRGPAHRLPLGAERGVRRRNPRRTSSMQSFRDGAQAQAVIDGIMGSSQDERRLMSNKYEGELGFEVREVERWKPYAWAGPPLPCTPRASVGGITSARSRLSAQASTGGVVAGGQRAHLNLSPRANAGQGDRGQSASRYRRSADLRDQLIAVSIRHADVADHYVGQLAVGPQSADARRRLHLGAPLAQHMLLRVPRASASSSTTQNAGSAIEDDRLRACRRPRSADADSSGATASMTGRATVNTDPRSTPLPVCFNAASSSRRDGVARPNPGRRAASACY